MFGSDLHAHSLWDVRASLVTCMWKLYHSVFRWNTNANSKSQFNCTPIYCDCAFMACIEASPPGQKQKKGRTFYMKNHWDIFYACVVGNHNGACTSLQEQQTISRSSRRQFFIYLVMYFDFHIFKTAPIEWCFFLS